MIDLTKKQEELLTMLIEEAGEIVQIGCKILRHGYDSYNPFDEHKTPNRKLLENEILDINSVIHMMKNNKDINSNIINN